MVGGFEAILSKSSGDIKRKSCGCKQDNRTMIFPIILKEYRYLAAYMLFKATAVVKREKIIIIAIINVPFVPST